MLKAAKSKALAFKKRQAAKAAESKRMLNSDSDKLRPEEINTQAITDKLTKKFMKFWRMNAQGSSKKLNVRSMSSRKLSTNSIMSAKSGMSATSIPESLFHIDNKTMAREF